jgi:hypothetical protein
MKKTESIGIVPLPKALTLVFVLALFLVSPTLVGVMQQAHATNDWRYNAGYNQGLRGIVLKDTHTQEFIAGYSNGTYDRLYDRGYAEGYSHMPMSSDNPVYVKSYKQGKSDYAFTLYDKSWTFLGKLPTQTNDDYVAFYQGWKTGDAAYTAQEGHNIDLSKCPSGHSAEFCAGYKFGYFIPANGDAS